MTSSTRPRSAGPRSITSLIAVSLLAVACGDDAAAPSNEGGGGASAAATTTSLTIASVGMVSSSTTSASTSASPDATSSDATSSSDSATSSDSASTSDSASSTASGGPTFDEACDALCSAVNAAYADAGCDPDDCDDICAFYARPGCEAEGAAAAACDADSEIVCSCDETSFGCELGSGCDETFEAYVACEGECAQLGTGTPEEARDAFLEFCGELVALADAGACTGEVDCDQLADSVVPSYAGCEAEAVASLSCRAAAIAALDHGTCSCPDGDLSCEGYSDEELDPPACEREEVALAICANCR